MIRHLLAVLLFCTLAQAAITTGSLRDEEIIEAPTPTPSTPAGKPTAAAAAAAANKPSKPAAAAASTLSSIDQLLKEAIEQTAADGLLAGEQAHREFCVCDTRTHGRTLCDAMVSQCHDTFCNPICLNMAWQVELEVDCAAAPQWKFCELFKEQVAEASRALTSQFQAHICMESKFCNSTDTAVMDWVENHSYGHKYPNRMLPIDTCLPNLHALHPKVGASTCKACSAIVSAKIRRGTCQPGFVPGYEVQEMSTLTERCEFVADFISTHAHSLLLELQKSVCTCLGCCDATTTNGGKECYLPSMQRDWISDLITRVSSDVTSKLREEKKKELREKMNKKKEKRKPILYTDLKMEL